MKFRFIQTRTISASSDVVPPPPLPSVELGWQSCSLLGHSMGGNVAMFVECSERIQTRKGKPLARQALPTHTT